MPYVIVDSTRDRRLDFADALGVEAEHCYASVADASESPLTSAIWFVHFTDLEAVEDLDSFLAILQEQSGCVFYSGAGLVVTSVGEGQLQVALAPNAGETPFSLDMASHPAWEYVRRPLNKGDAAVLRAIPARGQLQGVAGLVQAIEGREWPESFVALYLCALALQRGDNALRDAVTENIDLAQLTSDARAEARERDLGELTRDLSADTAEQVSGEIRECLKQLAS